MVSASPAHPVCSVPSSPCRWMMRAVLVPPLVPSGVSPLILCLLDVAAVCLDASPPSSHRFISSLVLGCLPFSACLGSCLLPLRPVINVGACAAAVPWFLATRPASSTRRRGDTITLRRFPRLCLLAPFGSPSHPCGSASDGNGARVLAPLDYLCLPVLVPWPSSVPPANRSLAQSDFLAVMPSCRHHLIAHLPDRSTRGTGRGLLVLAACLCGSFSIAVSISPAVYLCGFCECCVCGLSCLLGCCIFIYVDGGWDKRDGACLAFDCLTRPFTRFSLRPPLRRISGPGFFFFILSLPG